MSLIFGKLWQTLSSGANFMVKIVLKFELAKLLALALCVTQIVNLGF
jgi:hypothetical protein